MLLKHHYIYPLIQSFFSFKSTVTRSLSFYVLEQKLSICNDESLLKYSRFTFINLVDHLETHLDRWSFKTGLHQANLLEKR